MGSFAELGCPWNGLDQCKDSQYTSLLLFHFQEIRSVLSVAVHKASLAISSLPHASIYSVTKKFAAAGSSLRKRNIEDIKTELLPCFRGFLYSSAKKINCFQAVVGTP
jgi:hypothetical protein